MTAAVYNLFAPGEKVLVAEAGKIGERWVEIDRSRGLECAVLSAPRGQAVKAEDVPPWTPIPTSRVLIQMSETSTGVLHPVREVAAITRTRNVLCVVDGISGVSLSPCPMDQWGVDCLVTGSQKGLMLPPGLALLALSARAWDKAEKTGTGCFYFDLCRERDNVLKNQTRFTTPVNLIVGLDVSLKMLLAGGLDAVYRTQWALTMFTRAAVKAMGLELLAPDDFAWGITSVLLPEGVDGNEVLRLAAERHNSIYMAWGGTSSGGRIARTSATWAGWTGPTWPRASTPWNAASWTPAATWRAQLPRTGPGRVPCRPRSDARHAVSCPAVR